MYLFNKMNILGARHAPILGGQCAFEVRDYIDISCCSPVDATSPRLQVRTAPNVKNHAHILSARNKRV